MQSIRRTVPGIYPDTFRGDLRRLGHALEMAWNALRVLVLGALVRATLPGAPRH